MEECVCSAVHSVVSLCSALVGQSCRGEHCVLGVRCYGMLGNVACTFIYMYMQH